MTGVELLLLHYNTCNHLTVCEKWAQVRLKLLSTKFVYKPYIYIYIYIWTSYSIYIAQLAGAVEYI